MSNTRISIVTNGVYESVWASRHDDTPNIYTVENVPFHSKDVHLWDVVVCEPITDGLPVVQRVLTPSGFRTLQVHAHGLPHRNTWQHHPIHKAVHDAGWGGEGGFMGCVVAIPPDADVSVIETWQQLYPELNFKLV